MASALFEDLFWHDGRGPELQGVHWSANGCSLRAVDYFNPDDAYEPGNLKNVAFHAPQVVKITPEEVFRYPLTENDSLSLQPTMSNLDQFLDHRGTGPIQMCRFPQ